MWYRKCILWRIWIIKYTKVYLNIIILISRPKSLSRKWTESSHKTEKVPLASLLAMWCFFCFMAIWRHDTRLSDKRSVVGKMSGVSALSLIVKAKREREENREDNEGKDLYIAFGYIKVFSSYKCWICLILRKWVYVE